MHNPRTLVSEPGYLLAWVWDHGNSFTVEAYSSVLYDLTSRLYAPVRKGLDDRCHAETEHSIIEDDEMVFGEARRLAFYIWEGCPGSLVTHQCNKESSNEQVSRDLVQAGEVPR